MKFYFAIVILAACLFFVSGQECPELEIVPSCKPCIVTCADHINPPTCNRDCQENTECYCAPGMVRNENGACILKELCPNP